MKFLGVQKWRQFYCANFLDHPVIMIRLQESWTESWPTARPVLSVVAWAAKTPKFVHNFLSNLAVKETDTGENITFPVKQR